MHALFQNLISLIKMSHTKNEHELLATPLHSLSLLPKPEYIPRSLLQHCLQLPIADLDFI